jgi:hypothetical protein
MRVSAHQGVFLPTHVGSAAPRQPKCILTVDLENCPAPDSCKQRSPLVESHALGILDVLDRYSATATFFICDCVAQGHPAVVREVRSRGHEVACHGAIHPEVAGCTPEQFRRHARTAKQRLEDIAGATVGGFRAAGLPITRRALLALELLADEGFQYDSSVNPFRQPTLPRLPTVMRTGSGTLVEIPSTVARVLSCDTRCGGFAWRRLPAAATATLLSSVWRRFEVPGVISIDSTDFGSPSVCSLAPELVRLKYHRRLIRLLTVFTFETCIHWTRLILVRSGAQNKEVELVSMLPEPGRLWRYFHEFDSY